MSTDWSQFKPVSPDQPDDVDWSQFQPAAPASSGGPTTRGRGPVPEFVQAPPTSSPWAGLASRVDNLSASILRGIGTVSENTGDWLDLNVANLSGLTPEQIKNERQLSTIFDLADAFQKSADARNYQPDTEFAQVKQAFNPSTDGSLVDRAATIGDFIRDQTIVSLPDMAASVLSLPTYITGRTQEIAERRVQLDGREGLPTMSDQAAALPAATLESVLERFATGRVLPGGGSVGGTVAGRIGKEAAVQGGTEFTEEVAANVGETAGTKRGFDLGEATDAGMAGALVGGPLGAGVQGGKEVVNAAVDWAQFKPVEQPAQPAPAAQPEPQPVAQAAPAPTSPAPAAPVATPPPAEPQAPAAGAGATIQPTPVEPPAPVQQPAAVQPVEPPAAPAQPVQAPQAPAGNRRTVTTASGRKVDTEFQVVDLATLQAATGDLQNRDRTRATSDLQIQNIAGNLDPQRLGDSAEADRGAPIVGPDNIVESGNGRVAAIRKAYESIPERADAYRQYLISQGYNVDGMNQPVLVRRRVTEMTPEERRAFVIEANTSATARLNATEQAKSDADLIGDDVMQLYKGGEFGTAGNRDFVRGLVGKLPQSEQAALYGADGALSQEGIRRIQNAMLARAYGDAQLLSKFTEDSDNNIRSVGGAMLDVSGAWAKLRGDVRAGRVRPEFDITNDIVAAAQRISLARDRGETVQQVLSQSDAFNPMSPVTEKLIRAFYDKNLTRAAGREKIAETLRAYVDQASQQTTDANLFGDLPAVTPEQILDAQLGKRVEAAPAQQTSMFGAGGRPTVQASPEPQPAVQQNKVGDTIPSFLESSGFKKAPSDSDRRYKSYSTWERDGVRVALSSNVLGVENGTVVKYSPDNREMTIEALLVDEGQRGQGKARQSLNEITAAADRLGRTLYLEPAQLDAGGLTAAQLADFYGRSGFVPTDASGKVMVREPGASTTSQAQPERMQSAPMEDRAPSAVPAAPDERVQAPEDGMDAGRLYSAEALLGKVAGAAVGLNERTVEQYSETVKSAFENITSVANDMRKDQKGFFRKMRGDTGRTALTRLVSWYWNDEHTALENAIKALEKQTGKPQPTLRRVLGDFGFSSGTEATNQETYHEEYDARVRAQMTAFEPTSLKIDGLVREAAKRNGFGFRQFDQARDLVGEQIIKQIQSGFKGEGTVGDVAESLRKLFRDEFDYRKEAGIEHGDLGPNYVPVVYKSEKVEADANAVANVKKAYMAEGVPEMEAQQQAEAWVNRMILGQSTPLGGSFDSVNAMDTKERSFRSQEARDIMDKYRILDVQELVQRYSNGTARQAAIARRYGQNFSDWKATEDQIRQEGGGLLVDQVRRYVRDGVGIRSEERNDLMDSAATTVRTAATLASLERSLLPNLIESVMPIVQSADMATSLETLKGLSLKISRVAMKPFGGLPLTKREAAIRELAQDIGALAGTLASEQSMSRYYGALPESKRQAKWLNSFFHGIGMHQLADSLRENSVRAWTVLSRSLAKDVTGKTLLGGNFKNVSMAAMRNLGVPAGKETAFAEYVLGLEGKVPSVEDLRAAGEMGRLYSLALRRFVRSNQLEASGNTRPQWANSRYGALIFQLQSYIYLFHKAVNQKYWNQLKRGLNPRAEYSMSERAWLATGMIPGMLVMYGLAYGVEEIRDWLRELAGSKRDLTEQAKLERAANMANIMGKYSKMFESVANQRYGTGNPAADLLTPMSAAQMGKAVGAGWQAFSEKETTNSGDRRFAKAVFNTVLEPMWQIVLSSGPGIPFGVGSIFARSVAPSMMEGAFVDATAGEASAKSQAAKKKPIKGVFETLSGGKGAKDPKASGAVGKGRSTGRETGRTTGRETGRDTGR